MVLHYTDSKNEGTDQPSKKEHNLNLCCSIMHKSDFLWRQIRGRIC